MILKERGGGSEKCQKVSRIIWMAPKVVLPMSFLLFLPACIFNFWIKIFLFKMQDNELRSTLVLKNNLDKGQSYSEFQGFRSLLASQLFSSGFWLLLTWASFFEAAKAVSSKNWFELKIEQPLTNLASLNWWNTLQQTFFFVQLIFSTFY